MPLLCRFRSWCGPVEGVHDVMQFGPSCPTIAPPILLIANGQEEEEYEDDCKGGYASAERCPVELYCCVARLGDNFLGFDLVLRFWEPASHFEICGGIIGRVEKVLAAEAI